MIFASLVSLGWVILIRTRSRTLLQHVLLVQVTFALLFPNTTALVLVAKTVSGTILSGSSSDE